MPLNEKRWDLFKRTVVERNVIYVKKEILKLPAPWTEDPVFREFRFCNVFRDLDKVYRLLGDIPRDALSKYYWATRLMLRWSSSEALIKETVRSPLLSLMLMGSPVGIESYCYWATEVFTGPFVTGSFIVKRPGGKKGDVFMLSTYYKELVKLDISSWKGKTIKECGRLLRSVLPWCGSFTSYCLLSDLMYEDGPLAHAPDLYTYAEKGPGGIRGMAHLYGVDPGYISNAVWNKQIPYLVERWKEESEAMSDNLIYCLPEYSVQADEEDPVLRIVKKIRNPTALDVEHWLCEYYKYVRGSAKRRYKYV